jgi:hypothetical protein
MKSSVKEIENPMKMTLTMQNSMIKPSISLKVMTISREVFG